jgi:hypothetical protein
MHRQLSWSYIWALSPVRHSKRKTGSGFIASLTAGGSAVKHSRRIHALILTTALLCAPMIADDPRLSPKFKTVYILEMSNGLDQHLANRLTGERLLWVVLEPSRADAILTESLDQPFWTWLARVYPSPPGALGPPSSRGSASRRDPLANSRRPGMVFLVDPRAKVVLWSAWERPRGPSPDELEHSAERIANHLKAAFGRK